MGNVAVLRETVGPDFELLGVVKADAYGHGAALCAPVLRAAGVRWLGVADAEEGRRVREALRAAGDGHDGRDGLEATHVVVMCGFEPAEATEIVAARLTPVIWTVEHIDALERAAARRPAALRQGVAVHLEIDSGMARQGVAAGPALAAVLERLARSPAVRCEGVFSHLSSSEVVDSTVTAAQCERFGMALRQVEAAGVRPRFVHLGNSSAVEEGSSLAWVRAEAERMGARAMVRPGLALYGYGLPLRETASDGTSLHQVWPGGRLRGRLQPVARWTACVVGLREVGVGDTVGYGASFVAERPMRLALLPIGYADGFRREASSGVGDGWVTVAGVRAPVAGRVSMNLTVVDVTEHAALGLPVAVGTEAALLGEGVTAADHARWARTIPYEILCGLRGHRRLQPAPDGTL